MSGDVIVLGAGMHPWGKWGRNFRGLRHEAALMALDDAEVDWTDIQFVAGGETVRNGYPGFVTASTFAQALGWNGARVASCYAACASGVTALEAARTRILAGLCDVALVIGGDTTPNGFLAPTTGERWDDPDWLRFRLIGATNPTYSRYREATHGPGLRRDRPGFRQREGQELPTRTTQSECALSKGSDRRGGLRLAHGGQSVAAPGDLCDLRRRRRGLCSHRRTSHGTAPAAAIRCASEPCRRSRRCSRTRSSRCRISAPIRR